MSTSEPDFVSAATSWVKNHVGIVVTALAVLLAIISVLVFLSWKNSIYNEGFGKQRAVLTQYNMYQTSLSTCLDQTNIGAQVASEEYEQVKNVLTTVVGARYGDEGALSEGGAFVSALAEQYPEIDRSLWKQLMTTALGCRSQVAGVNNELQALAGRFETWSRQGAWYAKPLRNNWPNGDLRVAGLTGPLSGQDALLFIITPITTGQATQAILTHEMPEQDLFPGSGGESSTE